MRHGPEGGGCLLEEQLSLSLSLSLSADAVVENARTAVSPASVIFSIVVPLGSCG
jgi:hypothetical protein